MRNFAARLIWLLVIDVASTAGYTYTPTGWIMTRDLLDGVILIAMATTMLITFRNILEDF